METVKRISMRGMILICLLAVLAAALPVGRLDAAPALAIYGNPTTVGPFTSAGYVKVFAKIMTGTGTNRITLTQGAQTAVLDLPECPSDTCPGINLGLVSSLAVSPGDTIQVFLYNTNDGMNGDGWSDPTGTWTCGWRRSGDGVQDFGDLEAMAEANGATIIARQCWEDWTDADYNDLVLIITTAPPAWSLDIDSVSPASPQPDGTNVTVSASATNDNNGTGLQDIRFYVNCDPGGGTGGAWHRFGTVNLGGATSGSASATLDPNSAGVRSACGTGSAPLTGQHALAVNAFFTADAWAGDLYTGGQWAAVWSANTAARVRYFTWDSTAPQTTHTLAGTPGLNGWYVSDVQVTLTAVDLPTSSANAGIAATYLDGTAYTSPRTYTAQGTTTFNYYSVDRAGNVEPVKTASFKIDSVAPASWYSLSGTLGTNGWYISPVTFTMSASDATSGVLSKLVSVNGGPYVDLGAGPGPDSYTISAQGNLTVRYRARDNAGNYEPIRTLSIRIDSAAPACAQTSFTPNQTVSGMVNMRGNASDAASGLPDNAVDVTFDGGASFTNLSTAPPSGSSVNWGPVAWDTTTVPDGTYLVGCRARDDAGNVSGWSLTPVIVNNIPDLTLNRDYAYLPQWAPSVGLPAQTLWGTVTGGAGGPYTLTIKVVSPTGLYSKNYTVRTDGSGSFALTPAKAGDPNFGTQEAGTWRARANYQGISYSAWVTWDVASFTVHGTH